MATGREDKGKTKATAIELEDSDTDAEDELEALQPPSALKEAKYSSIDDREKSNGTATPASYSSNLAALLGDRAQMEKERLERQRKRKRELGLEDDDDVVQQGTDKKAATGSALERLPPLRESASVVQGKKSAVPLYWNGTVKKSFNQYSSTFPGTTFEGFLLPTTPFAANGLTQAVLATYCADIPWLARMFPKAPTDKGPNITFINLEEKELKPGVYSPMHPDLPNWVRLVVPRKGLGEYTTMHMKFLLLFYEDRLRLVILSGNMVEYDWAAIENTAFIHDFPKLAKGQLDTDSDYGIQMKSVLRSLSVPASHPALRLLSSYNMATTCEAKIVSSQPTLKPITGWSEIEKNGLGRLSKVVRDIMAGEKKESMTIEAQGSSMGTYSTRWLQQLHIVCSGLKIDTILPLPNGAKANKTWAQAVSRSESEKWPPIKLLFPSDRWVKTQSIGGTDGAGTFFGKSKQAVERGFVDILYQPVSIRGKIMMHHKAILALPSRAQEEKDPEKVLGWAYMGSHNLTQAAWGNLSQSKAGAETQCTIGNWELGVVMPIRQKDLDESQHKTGSQRMGANIITWQRPVEKYRAGDIPWDQFNQ